MTTQDEIQNAEDKPRTVPFWRVMLSIMQGAFGVQNRKNRERDFTSGSIKGFVVAALVFTVVFVLVLVTVVRMVLP